MALEPQPGWRNTQRNPMLMVMHKKQTSVGLLGMMSKDAVKHLHSRFWKASNQIASRTQHVVELATQHIGRSCLRYLDVALRP